MARSRSLDEMDDMEDVCLRISGKDPRLVASVATTEPPWHDEYTGRELAHEDVEKAMMKEMASHASFGVAEWVRESEADGFDIELSMALEAASDGREGTTCRTTV